MKRLGVIAGLVSLCLAACGSSGPPRLEVVVSAPVSSQPWIARSIVQGAQLAVDDANARGGVRFGTSKEKLKLVVMDNGGSPANALANARTAVSHHALALLTDGTGAVSVASATDPAHLPVFVCFDGGASLIDPKARPTQYRMAPADPTLPSRLPHSTANPHPPVFGCFGGGASLIDPKARPTLFRMAPADPILAGRLADYIANSHPRVALLTDDSGYGQEGHDALRKALVTDKIAVVSDQTL